jgi:hypothetical protein
MEDGLLAPNRLNGMAKDKVVKVRVVQEVVLIRVS